MDASPNACQASCFVRSSRVTGSNVIKCEDMRTVFGGRSCVPACVRAGIGEANELRSTWNYFYIGYSLRFFFFFFFSYSLARGRGVHLLARFPRRRIQRRHCVPTPRSPVYAPSSIRNMSRVHALLCSDLLAHVRFRSGEPSTRRGSLLKQCPTAGRCSRSSTPHICSSPQDVLFSSTTALRTFTFV